MIFGMGPVELVIILLVVLLIFGPKNLPKLGSALGKGIKGLRRGVEHGKEKIDEKFEEGKGIIDTKFDEIQEQSSADETEEDFTSEEDSQV